MNGAPGAAACANSADPTRDGKAVTNGAPAGGQTPDVVRISSGGLVYSGILRQADFTGGFRAETVDGTIRAAQGTAYLKANPTHDGDAVMNGAPSVGAGTVPSPEGSLDRVVASGHVVIDQPGLQATGERLVYTASDRAFLLTGDSRMRLRRRRARRVLRRVRRCGCAIPAMAAAVIVLKSWELCRESRLSGCARTRGSARIRRRTRESGDWDLAAGIFSKLRANTGESGFHGRTRCGGRKGGRDGDGTTRTLETEEIGKAYSGRQVVRGVSMQIAQGEVVGLLGPNGAGKTTCFYMIVGLVRPETGRVVADGDDITRLPMYLRARQYGISYLPQEPSIFRKLTVEENILAVLEAQQLSWESRRTRTEKLIEQLNLGHVRKTMGYALSGGERRRVEIARCLAIEPAFILLDEPFSGIDPIAVLELQEIIFDLKVNGIGVLITDHNVRETLSVTDRAYIINDGRILFAGTPGELGRNPEVRRIYLGEKFSMD